MAFILRYLTFGPPALAILLSLQAPSLRSETSDAGRGAPAVTFRTFCVNLNGYVQGLFYDNHGKQIPLTANNVGLSSVYPCPPGGHITVYRELPPVPPETKPRRVTVAETRLGDGGPWLLLISATRNPATPDQPDITLSAIDSSWKKHPAGQIRIFNFCSNRAAFQIHADTFELSPGQDRIIPAPAGEQAALRVKVALQKSGQWQLSINRPQRIPPPDMPVRLSWALLEIPPDAENPEPRFLLRNLLENSPIASLP